MLNFNDVSTVAWHEYLTNVRRRGFIIGTLLPPTLIIVIIIVGVIVIFFIGRSGLNSSDSSDRSTVTSQTIKKVGLVDQSGHLRSFPAEFEDRYILFSDEMSAKQTLLENEIRLYLVLGDDYFETGTITAYHQKKRSYVSRDDLRVLLIKGLLFDKVDKTTVTRITDPVDLTYIGLDADGNPLPVEDNPLPIEESTSIAEFVDRLPSRDVLATAAGVLNLVFFMGLTLMLIFASGSYLFNSISEEKTSRIIEIVLSSISANALLTGKIIGFTALTLTQVGVWLGCAVVFSGGALIIFVVAAIVLNPVSFLLGIVYCGLGYLIYAIIMAVIGAGTSNMRESQPLLAIFMMIPLMSAYPGCFVLALPELSNTLFFRLLSFFPFTAPMIMIIRLTSGNVPVIDIMGSIAVLLLTNAFVLWAGVKVFRASLLMYGQRPTLKQIVKIVKTA